MTQLSQHDCVRLLANVATEMRSAIVSFADPATLAAIDRSIEQANAAIAGALPNVSLRDSANLATQLTGKAELYSQGLYLDDADRDTPLGRLSTAQLTAIRDVADVAARSLRAATGDSKTANDECRDGLSWGYALAERLGDDDLLARIDSLSGSAAPLAGRESGNHPMHTERRWWAFWEWLRRSPPPGDR